ncbi:MAG: RNA 2',3'-cyclic phosphodiesterase [Halanaerobiales bacterium]
MRLFIAVPIEKRTQKLLEAQIELAQTDLNHDLKWVSGDNLHLTLKFLGDTNQNKLSDIKESMKNTCSPFLKFNIYYDHFGAFPSTDYPKVLYFGLKNGKNTLIKLQNKLENDLFNKGFQKEDRDYTPHLTFARTRKKTNMRQLKYDYQDFIKENNLRILQKVNKVALIESQLYKSGPVYEELYTVNLK